MGSFVPWLYYGFYCHYEHKLVYLSVVLLLGFFAIIVSLYDKFSEPQLRPVRAGKLFVDDKCSFIFFWLVARLLTNFSFCRFDIGVFASFGLSGIIPAVHYGIMEGWFNSNGALVRASLGWLILMGT